MIFSNYNNKVFLLLLFFAVFFSVNLNLVNPGYLFAVEPNVPLPGLPDNQSEPGALLSYYLKYLFDIGTFLGFFFVFLSLVWAGILYFVSPISPTILAKAKDRVTGSLSGLLILTLLYLILITINPELVKFNLPSKTPLPPPPTSPSLTPPGVYLFPKDNCPSDEKGLDYDLYLTSKDENIKDYSLRGNPVSAKIVHLPPNYYIAILYDGLRFRGRCQYITPDNNCQKIKINALSASIHRYSFHPTGSVIFYRKPNFDPSGGYYIINSVDVGKGVVRELSTMKFEKVPESEQECKKWDEKGKCIEKKPPDLSAQNIGSIKIDGNYLLLFILFSDKDENKGPWTFCQAFPTAHDDKNKLGPMELKWEEIMNKGLLPNFVAIIPLEEK